MSSNDEFDAEPLAGLMYHVLTEEDAHSANRIESVAGHIRHRVAPEQIHREQIGRWVFQGTRDLLNVSELVQMGREAAMHAKNSTADQTSHRHPAEDLIELDPNVVRILFAESVRDLVIEAVLFVDGSGLVVPAQQLVLVWVATFEGKDEKDTLERVTAAVHVVTEKHELVFEGTGQGRVVPVTDPLLGQTAEHAQQVVELTVDVWKKL